jgi:hypothetical protein
MALSTLGLAACAGQPDGTRPPTPNTPDTLARYRLPATAPAEDWARHLDLSAFSGYPQLLALSGGAEDGAFGAGALCGWSQRGGRPDFDIVTGVSIGALIAPFAFLGPRYDPVVARLFTGLDAGDIMGFNGTGVISGGSLYDTAPLAQLVEDYTPVEFLDEIAERHRAGARLFVVTSNVEIAQAMVWNMGAIAQAGWHDTFRAVLRASSALPGLFPAVRLRLGRGEEAWTETHIDGGVHMQMLAAPDAALDLPPRRNGGGKAYIIVNNTLQPDPQVASRTALGLAQQAMTTMVRASAASSVAAARMLAQRQRIDLAVTSVEPDPDVIYDPTERFSGAYMQSLFRQARSRALSGRLWQA